MFNLNLNYNSFIYPWENSSLSHRLNVFAKKTKPIILYIYEQADCSTFRYRVYNVCQALQASKNFSSTYGFVKELDVLLRYIYMVDIVVLVRVQWSYELDKLFSRVNAKNIKIYFDIDDIVYDVSKIPLLMNTVAYTAYEYWFSYVSRLFLAASRCDAYITTNEFLAQRLSEFFGKKIFIIKNFINHEQIEASNAIIEQKNQIDRDKDTILLGYFSGTPSHYNDFKSISSELYELMQKNEKIKLRIVGYLSLPDNLAEFVASKRVECLPLQNYLDLQVKIAECDVNLIPLLVNEFTNCKSELKYFEASIVNVASIAAPTFIYKKVIQDGMNGYIAMPGEWSDKVHKIITDQVDHVVENSRRYALENYFGEKIIQEIQNVFLAET